MKDFESRPQSVQSFRTLVNCREALGRIYSFPEWMSDVRAELLDYAGSLDGVPGYETSPRTPQRPTKLTIPRRSIIPII